MSYILEALKKADAAREREREAVPGLHSRHDHALPDDADERSEATPAARTPWLIGGIAGGVVIAGALFWLLGRSGPNAPATGETRPMPMHGQVGEAPPPPGGVAPTPPQTMRRDPVMSQAPVTPPALAAAPVTAVPPPATVPPATTQATQAPVAQPTAPQPAVVTTPPPAAIARMPSSGDTNASTASTTSNARATPATPDPLRVDSSLREAGPKIVPMQELPDEIRRELPQLTVGGAMHSDLASNRMLVLNGGVFREGDQPAPGVMLEEIRLKSAVLRYKGHRYSISY